MYCLATCVVVYPYIFPPMKYLQLKRSHVTTALQSLLVGGAFPSQWGCRWSMEIDLTGQQSRTVWQGKITAKFAMVSVMWIASCGWKVIHFDLCAYIYITCYFMCMHVCACVCMASFTVHVLRSVPSIAYRCDYIPYTQPHSLVWYLFLHTCSTVTLLILNSLELHCSQGLLLVHVYIS